MNTTQLLTLCVAGSAPTLSRVSVWSGAGSVPPVDPMGPGTALGHILSLDRLHDVLLVLGVNVARLKHNGMKPSAG